MLGLKEKLNQMFILGLDGLGAVDLIPKGLGGIIFFTRHITSKEEIIELNNKIKEASLIPPFLAIDQEGGRVERTENIHNGKKYLSAKFAYENGLDFLKSQTQELTCELKELGFNLNYAPCVDVNTNPNNPIIGERAFSSNPDEVIEASKIVIDIHKQNNIIHCIKHFPGHGDANADSHLTLPLIDLSMEDMEKFHIKPFKELINYGTDMIMVAHLHCTCFEKEPIPTSLSKRTIDYIRNNLKYDGVLISDDMVMKGVANFGETQACIMAIKAGLNLLIYRCSTPNIIQIIDEVYEAAKNDSELAQDIETSFDKIIKLKEKYFKI